MKKRMKKTITILILAGIGMAATLLGAGSAFAQSCEELTNQVKAQLAAVKEESKKDQAERQLQAAESAQQRGDENACIISAQRAMQTLGISPKKGS